MKSVNQEYSANLSPAWMWRGSMLPSCTIGGDDWQILRSRNQPSVPFKWLFLLIGYRLEKPKRIQERSSPISIRAQFCTQSATSSTAVLPHFSTSIARGPCLKCMVTPNDTTCYTILTNNQTCNQLTHLWGRACFTPQVSYLVLPDMAFHQKCKEQNTLQLCK